MNFGLLIFLVPTVLSFGAETSTVKSSSERKRADTIAQRRSYQVPYSYAEGACTSSEVWNLTEKFDDSFFSHLNASFAKSKWSPPLIAEASRLMDSKKSSVEARFLGKYWLARQFLQNHQYHIDYSLFLTLIDLAPQQTPPPYGVAWSSVQCILEISKLYPTLSLPSDFPSDYLKPAYRSAPLSIKRIYWDTALKLTQLNINQLTDPKVLDPILLMAKDSRAHTALIHAQVALMQDDYNQATKYFETFLSLPSQVQPLESEKNMARLLLGRAYYTAGKYQEAIKHFQLISKSSNLLIQALTDLSWSYLMTKNYSDALGTALSLQSPTLKNAYSPESLLVMGIAYYELCRYPESLQALRNFKRRYNPSYRYLRSWWDKKPETSNTPYSLLVEFLKNQDTFPPRLGTELLRSPVFLSKQSELNLVKTFTKEKGALLRFSIPQSKIAQADFRAVVGAFEKTILSREKRILDVINQDLDLRLKYLLWHLNQAGDNAEFLEAEILRKAGDDIVWQNLNPEFKSYLKKLQTDKTNERKFWNWGTTTLMSDDKSELWEDELGNFRAEVTNICQAKDDLNKAKIQKK